LIEERQSRVAAYISAHPDADPDDVLRFRNEVEADLLSRQERYTEREYGNDALGGSPSHHAIRELREAAFTCRKHMLAATEALTQSGDWVTLAELTEARVQDLLMRLVEDALCVSAGTASSITRATAIARQRVEQSEERLKSLQTILSPQDTTGNPSLTESAQSPSGGLEVAPGSATADIGLAVVAAVPGSPELLRAAVEQSRGLQGTEAVSASAWR